MPASGRKPVPDTELYATALARLARRAHSVYEMRQALERRSNDRAAVRRVLERLKQEKLLDDARYARQFARFRSESRRQGPFRIARDLRVRGVPDRDIQPALEELASGTDESRIVRLRIERQLSALRAPLNERKVASLYRNLLRAGFSADVIHTELRELTRGRISDIAKESAEDEESD
ncbi:MAG TPA: regulatory protein RecX [Candidatus Acidoferrales bacterium]|nr:regulatory protein RecX [Candidatus Acidoferrales bacterium]